MEGCCLSAVLVAFAVVLSNSMPSDEASIARAIGASGHSEDCPQDSDDELACVWCPQKRRK